MAEREAARAKVPVSRPGGAEHIRALLASLGPDVDARQSSSPDDWATGWEARTDEVRIADEFYSPQHMTLTVIILPETTSDFAYAAALHELGHAILRVGDEVAASRWAAENAIYWDAEMSLDVLYALSSYTPDKVSAEAFETLERTLQGVER